MELLILIFGIAAIMWAANSAFAKKHRSYTAQDVTDVELKARNRL